MSPLWERISANIKERPELYAKLLNLKRNRIGKKMRTTTQIGTPGKGPKRHEDEGRHCRWSQAPDIQSGARGESKCFKRKAKTGKRSE